ncbi:hypothetical protein [Flavobacterium maritimum]|uniref:hypothetical protein n=1 Tax=Flavobacterium maritimum TaxID=3149042 RepID=UPI0032B4720D
MTKKVLRPILISIIQIVGLAIIHHSLYYFYPMYHKSVGFGLTIFYTVIIFIISILAFNLYLDFFKRNIYLIALALLTVNSVFPLLALDYRPLRSLLLIILALCGFLSSLVLTKWKTKNKLEPKKKFHSQIEKYFNELSENKIPVDLIGGLVDIITDSQYDTYKRFWNQYPKSRRRFSKLKLEDLEQTFTHYKITDFFKDKDFENYKTYSMILLKMTEQEFRDYEMKKYQYETK